jgi:hypothetical protein
MEPILPDYVYVLTNWVDKVTIVGDAGRLRHRSGELTPRTFRDFVARYELGKLVYYDEWDELGVAIFRRRR